MVKKAAAGNSRDRGSVGDKAVQHTHSSAKIFVFYVIMLLVPLFTLLVLACWYGLDRVDRYTRIGVKHVGDNAIVFNSELGFRRPRNAVTRRIIREIEYNIYTDNLGARVNRPGAPDSRQNVTESHNWSFFFRGIWF